MEENTITVNINVSIRISPRKRVLAEYQLDESDEESSLVFSKYPEHVFRFPKIYDMTATQEQIYHDQVEPQVQSFLRGINCTFLTYGQTGTGKTYSIFVKYFFSFSFSLFLNIQI